MLIGSISWKLVKLCSARLLCWNPIVSKDAVLWGGARASRRSRPMAGLTISSDLRCGMVSCRSERFGNVALPALDPGPALEAGAGADRFFVGVGLAVDFVTRSGNFSNRGWWITC